MRTEVFVSYARKDETIARQIVDKLKGEGIIVWWDNNIPLTSDFRPEIKKALMEAQCVLVLWSESSIESSHVLDEAENAKNGKEGNQKLVQVCIDEVRPPVGFRQIQYKNLAIDGGEINKKFLVEIAEDIKKIIGIQGPKEHLINPCITRKGWDFEALAIETPVPGLDIFVSFRPCGDGGVFLLMRLDTTDGWVESDIPSAIDRNVPYTTSEQPSSYMDSSGRKYLKVKNDIFFIMDPVRPYGIQIGGLRSKRPSADPGTISGKISEAEIKMLPLQIDWLSMTLAEILSTKNSLRFLSQRVAEQHGMTDEIKNKIMRLIAKNPNDPLDMQKSMCAFCDEAFKEKRRLSSKEMEEKHGAYIIANDFPFGPTFHYLIITNDPVHSWENLTYKQIKGLNLIIHEFLENEKNRKSAAGVSFGFNSTIRHLILGSKTRSSAGASIPHIHKQAWGMPPRGTNIAERLIEVSQAYWNHGVDYQGAYYKTLKEAGYIIWEDEYVALYVPYGQSSMHELQVMVLEPKGCLTELTKHEVVSLSKAEYVALRIYKELGINSFNHVILSKLYNDTRAPKFRLVEAFITREVDLAVSELSMLFVVDQHPWDSCKEIKTKWDSIKREICEEIQNEEMAIHNT